MTTCLCGCGADVKRRFLPGHDSRYKSKLLAAARQGDQAAADELIANGWDKTTRTNYRPPKVKPVGQAKVIERALVDAEGNVLGRLEALSRMKAAAARLRPLGRYGRSSGERYLAISTYNAGRILDMTDEQLLVATQQEVDR